MSLLSKIKSWFVKPKEEQEEFEIPDVMITYIFKNDKLMLDIHASPEHLGNLGVLLGMIHSGHLAGQVDDVLLEEFNQEEIDIIIAAIYMYAQQYKGATLKEKKIDKPVVLASEAFNGSNSSPSQV